MSRPFNPLEFVLVVGIAFGQFSLFSILSLLSAPAGDATEGVMFGRSHLTSVMSYELVVTPMLLMLLYRTGWRLEHVGGGPRWEDVRRGAALACASYVVFYLSALAATAVHAAQGEPDPQAAGLPLVAAASLINGTFEELFVCGYVIRSLIGRFGPIAAMNVSTVIRVSYHLYQGPFAFVWVAMDGLLFGYCFLRWQRIWPLVCAHVALDFVALG